MKTTLIIKGSSILNPGPGGYCCLVLDEKNKVRFEIHKMVEYSTSNRLDLEALIAGLILLPPTCEVEIVSDSEYVIKGISSWRFRWRLLNWTRGVTLSGYPKPLINADLWKRIDAFMNDMKVTTRQIVGKTSDALILQCFNAAKVDATNSPEHTQSNYTLATATVPLKKTSFINQPVRAQKSTTEIKEIMTKFCPNPAPSVTAGVIEITPTLAKQWLKSDWTNRKVDWNRVATYKKQIVSGEWLVNGESISVGPKGEALNGQHRLIACVEADKSFWSVVSFNVDPVTFASMDSGKSRSGADVLSIKQYSNSFALAATLNLLLQYENGNTEQQSRVKIAEAIDRHPGIHNSVKKISSFGTKLRSAPVAFIVYACSQVAPKRTAELLSQLEYGANLEEGSPILALRNFIFSGTIPSKITGSRLSNYRHFMAVKAFVAFLENRKIYVLRRGATEEFPSIPGLPYGQQFVPVKTEAAPANTVLKAAA